MLRQPGAGFRLPEGGGPFNDAGETPDIGIQKERPAIRAQQFFGGDATGFNQCVDKIKQGTGGFTEVGDFRRPIIHLQINIHMIIRIPWRRG